MHSPAELTELFRARGLKVTPQRQCIFRIIHDDRAHPTAESVFERAKVEMPMISLRTVYGTLNDLADMGEIQQLDFGTGATRFDPNVGQHHHLVCRRCGGVRDVRADFPGLRVPSRQRDGFRIETAEVVFRGLCEQCTVETTNKEKG